MFGDRFFGARYFGNRFFGPVADGGGGEPGPEPDQTVNFAPRIGALYGASRIPLRGRR